MTSKISEGRLIKILSSIFRESSETSRLILEILKAGKRIVSYGEILSSARSLGFKAEDLVREAILSMYGWRMLLPLKGRGGIGLAWEQRACTFRPNELYEVPQCILYVFEEFQVKAVWNYRYAVEKYFRLIGEPRRFKIAEIVDEIVDKAYFKLFTNGAKIREICVKRSFPEEKIGVLVAELKGGGFMSPTLIAIKPATKLEEEMFRGAPIYELNKALFVLKLKKG
jgi:hypothetical protein